MLFSLFRRRPLAPPSLDYRALLQREMALFNILPALEQDKLLRFIPDFLTDKTFYGCNGHQVTDAQRVLVAANAALVGMNQPVGFFRCTRWILLYPDLHHIDGEAFDLSKVVLSWRLVAEESREIHFGSNLCIHEFAHVLDHRLGISGGTPAMRSGLERWQSRCLAGEEGVLAEAAAEGPEEFFAGASEAFFSAPVELATEYPDLYQDLQNLYGLDMASLLGPWPSDSQP